MPHIDIKSFPREFSEQEKQALADDITAVIIKRFASRTEAVSISLQHILPEDWQSSVYEPDIIGQQDYLIKKPGYSM
ncbi:tautomerase PptA [Rosenbergiella australiborealis]|uniref:Tautomerase PptA n=1 Tax=Rosenbergiella australiborealis TaxID=1544696 RepID=A0ABS5T4U8_9GAMM|nr:tautomerase PptA [Rosenbergiella australiborealis]MBT0727369.1 tautomerase PptA [Rosenbergiella australiborealis]